MPRKILTIFLVVVFIMPATIHAQTVPVDLRPITTLNATHVSEVIQLTSEVGVAGVRFSPDGKILASTSLGDGRPRLWDLATTQETILGYEFVEGLAFSPEGRLLAMAADDGPTVRLIEVASGREVLSVPGFSFLNINDVAFSPDGQVLATLDNETEPKVDLWDVETGQQRGKLGLMTHLSFSPDGKFLYGLDEVFLFTIFAGEVATGNMRQLTDSYASMAVFSPDGKMAAVNDLGKRGAVILWDVTTGEQLGTLEGEMVEVQSLTFNPDGSVLAVGGCRQDAEGSDCPNGEVIVLWDVKTGQSITTLEGHTGRINGLAFTPDGTLLASASDDETIRIWGTNVDGGVLQIIPVVTPEATSVAPSTITCSLSAPESANLRGGPGTDFERVGRLSTGQTVQANGQAQGADGFTWYHLTTGEWAREDVVRAKPECTELPEIST
jgi:WD40 repeat protein